ncbi:MAG: lysophospholipid acyltransferase family protein [Saprospiraceae bacterium]|nr:lysophospholipid acyltransferase family protein [Saprospiraceae bacterium]MCF8250325.1 lysophospholipid acyltransferase family protein [Saprospiraceae bacterium]MCF8312133.1 lysophospholipid acyltransferase family protein [Saprospiraceae bacterium]MCF8442185.1 lysophospholipid acyltransferase family protein [Saprospiraceae bacterium]
MDRIGAFFIKILVELVGQLPFRVTRLLSDLSCFLLLNVFNYRKRIVHGNLRKSFPEKNEEEIKVLSSQFYRHFSDMLLESVKGLTMSKAELQQRFVYRNPEIFQPLFEKKQSAILLGSHYGNWEWGVLSFPLSVQHTVVGTYKPLKNKALEEYLNSLRKQWGLHLADMAHTGRAIVSYKNQPSIFVLIADQTPSDMRNAHWTDFLHQDTPFLHGMDKLARKTGYPVFYFEIERVKRGFYEVTFSLLCEAPKNLPEGEITRLYANHLVATIRKSPANWLWSHRRWKRKRPVPSSAELKN